MASAVALLGAGAASAQSSDAIGPWDGENPFRCQNQDVGTGTDYPDPNADPFCVEFDKTSQNVTDFGLVDFFANEPSRVAAAANKCFYYQSDHWTGSVVQGGQPELWHWDGQYFFDRAKGIGGVHVSNFRIGGVPADFTPFVPAAYQGYVEPTGGGGVIYQLDSGPDPTCKARVDTPEERAQIYGNAPKFKGCIAPGGRIRASRVGRVRLGMSRKRVWNRLGPPKRRKTYVHRWCVVGGSRISVAYHRIPARVGSAKPSQGTTRRAVSLVRTTNPGHAVHRIGPGSDAKKARRRLSLHRSFRLGNTRAWVRNRGPNILIVGTRRGRVHWLALADPRRLHSEARIATVLRHAR